MRLAVGVGQGCVGLHDRNMVGVRSARIEMDEVWSYVCKKRRKGMIGRPQHFLTRFVERTNLIRMRLSAFTRLTTPSQTNWRATRRRLASSSLTSNWLMLACAMDPLEKGRTVGAFGDRPADAILTYTTKKV